MYCFDKIKIKYFIFIVVYLKLRRDTFYLSLRGVDEGMCQTRLTKITWCRSFFYDDGFDRAFIAAPAGLNLDLGAPVLTAVPPIELRVLDTSLPS